VQPGDWFCQTCGRPSCKISGEKIGGVEFEICGCAVPKWMVMDLKTGDTILPDNHWRTHYPEYTGTLGLPWESNNE
jgi:hypothetical protein